MIIITYIFHSQRLPIMINITHTLFSDFLRSGNGESIFFCVAIFLAFSWPVFMIITIFVLMPMN